MKRALALILALMMTMSLCACGGTGGKSIALGETVTAGDWEFTLKDITFAHDIGNYGEYENFLIPGGKKSNSNPLGLDDGKVFAVVTYTLKNIGKESRNTMDIDYGLGDFVFGDGYTFGSDYPSCYDKKYGEFNSLTGFDDFEPLSPEIECRAHFELPEEVVGDLSSDLSYVVKIGSSTFKYSIANRIPVN